MDSPVFERLQDAIQNPSNNKEWFVIPSLLPIALSYRGTDKLI